MSCRSIENIKIHLFYNFNQKCVRLPPTNVFPSNCSAHREQIGLWLWIYIKVSVRSAGITSLAPSHKNNIGGFLMFWRLACGDGMEWDDFILLGEPVIFQDSIDRLIFIVFLFTTLRLQDFTCLRVLDHSSTVSWKLKDHQ